MSNHFKSKNSNNQTPTNTKNLFDWKPINSSLKLFNANKNYPNSSRNSARPNSSQQLTPIFKRSNSLRDLNNNNINNSNNIKNDSSSFENQIIYDAFLRTPDLHSNSRLNFKRFEDLLDQNEIKTDQKTDKNEEKKNVDEILNAKHPQSVEKLELNDYNLQEIKNLDKFKNLKSLDLSCNQIKQIQNLDNLRTLLELKLYGNQIEIVENLESVSQLLSLQLQSNKIKKLDKGLSFSKNLQVLRLDNNKLTNIQQAEIAACSNLTHLNVSKNNISSLMFINSLTNLEELIANHMNLTTIEFDTSRCWRLTELDFSFNSLTDESLEILASLKYLTVLNVSNNSIKTVKQISKIKNLKILNASNNLIKKLEDLINLKEELEVLDISSNQIEDWFQIEVLVNCKELVEIELKNNPIMRHKTIDDIQYALPNIQLIDCKSTGIFAQTAIQSNLETSQSNNQTESNVTLQNDFIEFEHQMNLMNENFMKKLNEITDTLNGIEKKFNSDVSIKNVTIQPISSNSSAQIRVTSGHNRLSDALKFSKRYDELP